MKTGDILEEKLALLKLKKVKTLRTYKVRPFFCLKTETKNGIIKIAMKMSSKFNISITKWVKRKAVKGKKICLQLQRKAMFTRYRKLYIV